MTVIRKKKCRSTRLLPVLFLLLMVFWGQSTKAGAASLRQYRIPEDDPQVISLAQKNVLPKGKLVRHKGRTSYITKNKKRLKNTWIQVKGKVYCLNARGYARTGLYTYKGFRYYFNPKGQMAVKRLVRAGKKKYYCTKTGALIKNGWKKIRDDWYYFKADGSMARKKKVGEWYVGKDGRLDMDRGAKKIKTGRYRTTKKNRLIIVGASRVKQMAEAVKTDKKVIYIAKGGQGLAWMQSYAIPELRRKLKKYPKSRVVFQMGNNDISKDVPDGHIGDYIDEYRYLRSSFPKAKFFFMDALPSGGTGSKKNELRVAFNKALQEAFPKEYIGGYDYLMKSGFVCSYNRSHYSVNTSRKIYNYILRQVKNRR